MQTEHWHFRHDSGGYHEFSHTHGASTRTPGHLKHQHLRLGYVNYGRTVKSLFRSVEEEYNTSLPSKQRRLRGGQ